MNIAGIEVRGMKSAARAAARVLRRTPNKNLRLMQYWPDVPISQLGRLTKEDLAAGGYGCAVGQFILAAPPAKRSALATAYLSRRPVITATVTSFLDVLDSVFSTSDDVPSAKEKALRFCARVARTRKIPKSYAGMLTR